MSFEKIIGNNKIKNELIKAFRTNSIAHSYIFSGQYGIGKKQIAIEFAKMILCLNKDNAPCGECKSCLELENDNKQDFNIIKQDGKIKIELNNKKNIYINGIKIKKLSELLGNINIVLFNPDDINILKGGPQNRRRFLDVMISQLRPNYMHLLSLYLKTIEQRNKYLRQIKEEHKDEKMLDIWDEKLADYATKICEYRIEFIEKIKEKLSILLLNNI